MTHQEMWNQLVSRYPEFDDPEFIVKQRARGLRRLIEQAWDEGFQHGKATKKPDPVDELFRSMFSSTK